MNAWFLSHCTTFQQILLAGTGVLQKVPTHETDQITRGRGRVVYPYGQFSVQNGQSGGRGYGITCKVQQITRQVASRSQLEAALNGLNGKEMAG